MPGLKIREVCKVSKIHTTPCVFLPKRIRQHMKLDKGDYVEMIMVENPETHEKTIIVRKI